MSHSRVIGYVLIEAVTLAMRATAQPEEGWQDCFCPVKVETPKGSFSLGASKLNSTNTRLRGVVKSSQIHFDQAVCSATVSMKYVTQNTVVRTQTVRATVAQLSAEDESFVQFEMDDDPLTMPDVSRAISGSVTVSSCESFTVNERIKARLEQERQQLEAAVKERAQAELAESKAAAKEALQQKVLAARCQALKTRVANKRLADLTVTESDQMAACKGLGLW